MLDRVIRNIMEYANGREIVMYGKYDYVKNQLRESGYPVEKIFTGNITLLQDKTQNYINFKELEGQSDKYYVILSFYLPDKGVQQRDTMKKFGYVENEDYVFYPDKDFIKANPNGRFRDECGNVIEAKCKNVKVRILGVDNSVTIKEGVQVNDSLSIVVNGRGHKVVIGEKCVFNGTSQIMILENTSANSTIEIGDSCRFTNHSLVCRDNCKIKIGDKSTFALQTKIELHSNSKLIIGKDCMFSFDIVVQAGDGHSIFDIKTGKNISLNLIADNGFFHEIELEDHIWVGREAMIISGAKKTVVGEGSVIGANSFVKGVFPNNCTIAGIPAKVLKRNIAWSRKNQSNNIDDCAGYTRLTEE